VIRYYTEEKRDPFYYIALELCEASLADIIERPNLHQKLAQAGTADLPGVLLQIASGVRHLHKLRIVHRDLKPQNILVKVDGEGRPRLVVSDFGLCKKLAVDQSEFGATTARAAGTTGWRAPEVLVGEDNRDPTSTMTDMSSTHSTSGSHHGTDSIVKRATRAIDIFSLGLVYYYVLSKGSHPFDRGDRFMREANIRDGKYTLDGLDIYGEIGVRAKELIERMLDSDPKGRPTAEAVMAHCFFWSTQKCVEFLRDVSDYYEREPRDPPSDALLNLEDLAPAICQGDFLRKLPAEFTDSLGRQRKYTGSRMLDLLRAFRNKWNHFDDMPESLKAKIGGANNYLEFWTSRFPTLVVDCWNLGLQEEWCHMERFKHYYTYQRPG
jgi:serine/threonine-protein kinase/endoribonuclease IRE1